MYLNYGYLMGFGSYALSTLPLLGSSKDSSLFLRPGQLPFYQAHLFYSIWTMSFRILSLTFTLLVNFLPRGLAPTNFLFVSLFCGLCDCFFWNVGFSTLKLSLQAPIFLLSLPDSIPTFIFSRHLRFQHHLYSTSYFPAFSRAPAINLVHFCLV